MPAKSVCCLLCHVMCATDLPAAVVPLCDRVFFLSSGGNRHGLHHRGAAQAPGRLGPLPSWRAGRDAGHAATASKLPAAGAALCSLCGGHDAKHHCPQQQRWQWWSGCNKTAPAVRSGGSAVSISTRCGWWWWQRQQGACWWRCFCGACICPCSARPARAATAAATAALGAAAARKAKS